MKKVWRVEFEVKADSKEDVVKLFDRVEDTRKAQILSDEDSPDDEPMFIHCGLIEAMKNTIRYGYRIVY